MTTYTSPIADGASTVADATLASFQWISTSDLRQALLDGDEIALVDVREGDAYAGGHISVASPVPDSELELRIAALVPRRSVRLVLVDESDDGLAHEAASRLAALGYDDVRVLSGGVAGWASNGFELVTGLNSLSKALGEFVERRYHTPRITVEQLKAKIDAGEDIVVIDTRPLPEFTHISIPTGQAAPGAELLFRAFDRVPSPTTEVVVNCAGRTRAIIGAQALINAGFENPVVALENGTSAWQFAGLEAARGQTTTLERPTESGLARAIAAAARLRARFGVRGVGADELAEFRAEAEGRTLYLLDVRTPEEFDAGHLPGARSAPGGQLVQSTDFYIGTRHARIVLVDEVDKVRASVTASWLIQLGLDDVFVYGANASELTVQGATPVEALGESDIAAVISVGELQSALAAGEHLTVIDLQGAPAYFEQRTYVPGSLVARRSTLLREPHLLSGRGRVALTSADGVLAKLAASELSTLTDQPVLALEGGTNAWAAAGLPHDTAASVVALTAADALPPAPTLEQSRAAFAKYVQWGEEITAQLERDGIVRFRTFEDAQATGGRRPAGRRPEMTAGVVVDVNGDADASAAVPVAPGSGELQRLIEHIDDEVLERERERRPPLREFELVRAARLGALRLPTAHGGAGASMRQLFETVIELSAADPNLAHGLRNHFVFAESRLRSLRDTSDDGWLRKIAQGELFGAAATELSSAKAGRRDQNFATTLTRTSDGYRLNGTKFYSTGNLYSDWIVVSAQTVDETGVRVVVPAARPGVILDDDWDGIGQRLSGSGTTRFSDVRVEQHEILAESTTWFDDVPYLATLPQLYLTAVIAGILRRVVRDAVALVHGRQRTFYHASADSPADDPILQQTVGLIASTAYAAETLVLAAAEALGVSTDAILAGHPDNELALQASLRAAKAKVLVDDIAQRAASIVFDVGGATAVRQSSQLDRHWRNIRTLASHNPSTYKAKWIGGYEINGTPLPTGAFF